MHLWVRLECRAGIPGIRGKVLTTSEDSMSTICTPVAHRAARKRPSLHGARDDASHIVGGGRCVSVRSCTGTPESHVRSRSCGLD